MAHTEEELREVARIYTKHDGVIAHAARDLGISRTTFASRVETAKNRGFIRDQVVSTEETKEQKTVYLKPTYKIFQRARSSDVNCRVLAIGDAHDGPDLPDKTRFFAMGSYAAKNQVDHIVQIGDFASMDSMSSHDRNDTIRGQKKPSYKDDLESFEEALRMFDDGLDGYSCDMHVTLGNHEDRIARFVNNNPELADLLFEKFYKILTDHGWTYSPFGEFYFIGDVGFTHVPLNAMGKPYGGMNSENNIGKDSLHDVVYGHTHKQVDKPMPKLGHDSVTVLNLGCSLPQGHVEDYARHSLTGWSYGVYDIHIRNGKITERTWVPMDALIENYS